MGLGRNAIQEELSLAALGTELFPQPLAEPSTQCQFFWFCCEVASSPP